MIQVSGLLYIFFKKIHKYIPRARGLGSPGGSREAPGLSGKLLEAPGGSGEALILSIFQFAQAFGGLGGLWAFGTSGAVLSRLGTIWGHLEPSWGHLGAILSRLETIWGHLEPSWGHLGAMLSRLAAKTASRELHVRKPYFLQ